MNDLGPAVQILAGYVPLTRRGFALPCFAISPRPNAWYTATCSVDADHMGQVTGFEVFESNDILQLSPELHRIVRIGSPWNDVFLWKEAVLVGTPREIWSALEGERDEMLSAVPLTVLDLALAIPDENVTPLIGSALEFMRVRFGAEKAEAWRSETLARQQVVIGLRRLAREAGLGSEALASIGNLEIVPREPDYLCVQVPPDIIKQFAKLNRGGDLDSRIRETIERLGLILADTVADSSTVPATSLDKPPPEREPDVPYNKPVHTVRILIVAAEGKRVRDVERHISRPEWKPNWISQSDDVVLGFGTIDRASVVVTSSSFFDPSRGKDEPSSRKPDVIVLLFDEEHSSQELLFNLRKALRTLVGSNWTGVSLLAPALPENTPSEILIGSAESRKGFGNFGFDTVIDTSVVRSPFWTGNRRRAFDRRIADVVVGAALLCAGKSPLRRALRQTGGRRDTLLTFALGRDFRKRPYIGLASESTWPNLKQSGVWSARFTAEGGQPDLESSMSGVVQVRDRRKEFEDFGFAVLTSIAGVLPENVVRRPLPARLRKELNWPELSVGFRFGRTAFKGIAICAETPTLAALQAAGSERWAVLRYTDAESIRETSDLGSGFQLPYLPREVRLPNIPKRSENRGLATRGIDPRDVVRLANEEWQSWQSQLSGSLRAEVRRYRTSLPQPRRDSPDTFDELEFVLPRREVQQADQAAAKALLRYVDRRDRREQRSQSAGKRLADLRVAWSTPADGTSRYVLADGIIPCEFAELEPDEVPAQRFFIVDGDAAVPALLGSRIFAAWAKITLTRSTSWMPRFSISRTFETFPVPPPFLITRLDDGPAQLRIATRDKRLRNLARDLRGMFRQRSVNSTKELQIEIDRAILKGLNLEENAPDLAIVELLLKPEHVHYR